jgi:hypothetical protein
MKDWIKITRSNDALSGYILRAEIFMVCQNPEGGSEILLRQLGQNSCITATETPEEIMALLEGETAFDPRHSDMIGQVGYCVTCGYPLCYFPFAVDQCPQCESDKVPRGERRDDWIKYNQQRPNHPKAGA